MITKFKCGICRSKNRVWMARKPYRDHLKEHLRNELMNDSKGRRLNHVIEEEFV